MSHMLPDTLAGIQEHLDRLDVQAEVTARKVARLRQRWQAHQLMADEPMMDT